MIGPVLLAVVAIALGAMLTWDVRGFASTMHRRIQKVSPLHDRLPAWTFRAFGVYCILFAIGELVFFHFYLRSHH